jgi:glutamyl-tRNA synthetase
LLGITHTIRGKDHMDNERRQKYLFDYFGWKTPTHTYVGRVNFEGFDLSTTQTKLKIKNGEYSGWDDIRLPFIEAFKRRGYQSEAFKKFALSLGLTENDKTVTMEEFFKVLNHYNKEILDPITNRYFFIEKPVMISIENAPEVEVELNLHPDHPEYGKRFFVTTGEFYITKSDVEKLEDGKIYRLMDCLNFVVEGGKFIFHSQEYEKFKESKNKGFIMHYLPFGDLPKVEVLMPDGTVTKGLAEHGIEKLDKGTIIQAERFGFMRLDSIDLDTNTYKFWFTHK